MDRRTFLADLSRYAFFCGGIPNVWRVTGRPLLQADPFTLGVASGDPLQDRCVIWTRLAPSPLEFMGGMTGQRSVVGWEVAHDEAFSRIVRQGEYTAAPELGYSVHVDVEGLEGAREYFYRFTLGAGSSPTGRLRTAPAPGSHDPLEMAVASCQHWEQGLFTAYEHMAREDLHLVAHLGDYIYIAGPPPIRAGGRTRRSGSPAPSPGPISPFDGRLPGGVWPASGCWTPGSTGTTRRAATVPGRCPVATGETPAERYRGRPRNAGSPRGSGFPAPTGRCWPSRS